MKSPNFHNNAAKQKIKTPINGKKREESMPPNFHPTRENFNKKPKQTGLNFQLEVLSWNFFSIISPESHTSEHSSSRSSYYELAHIPQKFYSTSQYISLFDPLHLEETRFNIKKSWEEITKLPNHMRATNVQVVDATWNHKGFITLHVEFEPGCNDSASQTIKQWLGNYDLVLLSKEEITSFHASQQPNHALAFVDLGNPNSQKLCLRLCTVAYDRGDGILVNPNDSRENLGYQANKGTTWTLTKIMNISTLQRQHDALVQIDSVKTDILKSLLKADPMGSEFPPLYVPKSIQDVILKRYNESQRHALFNSLNSKITLIQGPPGTGKTITIIGLLSLLLNASHDKNISTNSQSVDKMQVPPLLDLRSKFKNWAASSPWLHSGKKRAMESVESVEEHRSISVTKKRNTPEEGDPINRILVCAPSNAAVDEIALRVIKEGLPGCGSEFSALEKEKQGFSKIIRAGANFSEAVSEIALETLVGNLIKKHKDMKDVALRNEILSHAKICFTTLSAAGMSVFTSATCGFDTVIIDEAAQSVELLSLIPLMYGCKRLIMVGDVAQLPATVFSPTSINFGYDRSLFGRLQEANFPVFLLQTQYRMHPEISYYPAKHFYHGNLKNSQEKVLLGDSDIYQQEAFYRFSSFGPYVFYDIANTKESMYRHSWQNEDEADMVVTFLEIFFSKYSDFSPSTIGIISPYHGQIQLFKRLVKERFSRSIAHQLEINTVDGFQGREKDIILFSCVRARLKYGVGFVADLRRMNVALTRARKALWIFGNGKALVRNSHWRDVIMDAQRRGNLKVLSSKRKLRSQILGWNKARKDRRDSAQSDQEEVLPLKKQRGVELTEAPDESLEASDDVDGDLDDVGSQEEKQEVENLLQTLESAPTVDEKDQEWDMLDYEE